jgi:acetolactate synthase-1/2/3 large subunit
MGSGLPMAIGASIAKNKKPVICMEGDGSIMLNIHELQTVVHHHLPIKIFIFNNRGYYSIRATHQSFFGKIFAASPETGVSLPDFEKIAYAWGIKYFKIAKDKDLTKIKEIMNHKGAVMSELILNPDQPMPIKWTAGQLKES